MSSVRPQPTAGDDVKERVRDAIDVVDLVGSYVSLRRSGKGFVGLCPWHEDSRPSLQVNPERQTFRCWVCDIGGDVFSFVMRAEKVEFREALEQLADRAGITLARTRAGMPADAKAALRTTLEWAAARFRACLTSAPEAVAARDYVTQRGLSAATAERFQLGFAPQAWDWLLKQASTAGIAAADLVGAGLAVQRQDGSGHYDRFRGRVIFPIRDAQGRCVAFGGRVLPNADDPAKYINSPETALFSKSSTLYGLDSARDAISKSRRAVVVEGYTDCIAARQAGIDDVVAVLGTALGVRHAALLRRYADRIVLVLDGDDAGRRRANEVLDVLLAEPIDVRIARLPSGVDPCEFILERGRAAFEALVDSAGDPLDYRMDEAIAGLAPGAGAEAALDAVESVLRALATTAADGQRRLREDQVLGRLARRFGLSRDALRGRMLDLRRAGRGRERDDVAAPAAAASPKLPAWDREVIEVLVGVPDAAGLIVRQVGATGVESPAGRTVLAAAERLHGAGRPVALADLLLEIVDPALQSLLVAIDEAGASRAAGDAHGRYIHYEEALRRRAATQRARENARALRSDRLDADTEAELLERLVADRRVAQGMSEPKDG
ncbi:MAG: DNA primase [Planctomycetaceae bacterium]